MTKPQRSPLGELVYAWRKKLHLTQADLVELASHPDSPDFDRSTVSLRTVSEIERKLPPGAPKPHPHRPSTLKALAAALDLKPDTPAYDEFLAAAHESSADDAAPPFPDAEIPLFVPDGREAHLERLAAAIDLAIRERAGVLFVEAAPGTGKTSLVAHVCRQALDRHERLVVLWGDCIGRAGAADPWQPFRQAMATLVGDTAAAGYQHLLSSKNAGRIARRAPLGLRAVVDDAPGLIDRFIPAESLRAQAQAGRLDAETARRLNRALDAAANPSSAPLDPGHLVFRVLRRYAAAGPVILVLEDLHWADTGTADMLSDLMRRLERQRLPVLVIATCRPLDLESSRLGDHPAVQHILLEATRRFDDPILDLSDTVGGAAGRAFVNAVVDQLLPDAPQPLRDTLFDQTAGLPLFVLTMLSWYLAEGQPPLIDANDTEDPVPARLPAVIETLFAGLIDRLPPDLPPLLDAASVQGASFSADVVMRVMGLSRPVLIERLDGQLTRRFKALYGDGEHDGSGRIAYHFDQAGERRKAAAAYVKAGIHALDRQDPDLARIHFDRVGKLDLRKEDPYVVAQALLGLGNCAYRQGDNEGAARLFERAHDLAQRENVPSLIVNTLIAMGWIDYNAGGMRVGSNRLSEAIDVLIDRDDAHELCRARVLHSHLLYGLGRYDDAAASARQAIAGATGLKDDMVVVAGQTALANCWIDIGFYENAIAVNEEAIAICGEHGNVHRASLCRVNLALAELERGRWDEASAALAIVFDPARTATSRLIGLAEFNAGLVAEGRKDLTEAHRRFTRSLEIRQAHEQHAAEIDSQAGLLRVATAHHCHADMHPLIADIRHRVDTRGLDGVGHPGRLFVALIGAWLELGDPARAKEHAREGVAFVNERVAGLKDPTHRASYLGNVAAHRTLFALTAELGVADD